MKDILLPDTVAEQEGNRQAPGRLSQDNCKVTYPEGSHSKCQTEKKTTEDTESTEES